MYVFCVCASLHAVCPLWRSEDNYRCRFSFQRLVTGLGNKRLYLWVILQALLVIKKRQGQREAAALGSDPCESVRPSLWTTGKDSSCHSKADTFSRSRPDGLHSLTAGTVLYACVALAKHRAWPLLSVNWCFHQLAWHKQRHGLTTQTHPVSPPSTGLAGAQVLERGVPQAILSFGSHHCHSVPQGNPSTSFF